MFTVSFYDPQNDIVAQNVQSFWIPCLVPNMRGITQEGVMRVPLVSKELARQFYKM